MVRKTVANHQVTAHAATTLERIRLVRAGKRLTGHHRVFGAAYRLLDKNQPAPTVTRSGFRDFIHPSRNRVCTVRELARLQSFPDAYVFKGRRCDTYAQSRYVQQTQHEQLGNAVPPLMARRIGQVLRKHILSHRQEDSRKRAERCATLFGPLDAAYPLTDLGNKKNPLDELIYILLSRRSREEQYQTAYRELHRRYHPWAELLKASHVQLVRALKPLGLAHQRARAIKEILTTIQADFGRMTLYPLKRMTYSEAYHYLRSLPGINDKSAKCVMLYSLGMAALPVDTHTLRVSKRLGLVHPRSSPFTAPRELESVVPRESRGRFHVLTVLHGRAVCTAQRPKCPVCPLRKLCPSAGLLNRSS